jgi:hypothetical protein
MRPSGRKAVLTLCCLLAAVMASVFLAACVENDNPGNQIPTQATGSDAPIINGTLQISPATVTFTLPEGSTGGGLSAYFVATGGKAPYYWSNSTKLLGRISGIDEFGKGLETKAKYVLADNASSGIDNIVLRDGDGSVAIASLKKEYGAVVALNIVPGAATILPTGAVVLTATGGVGPFAWGDSDPTATLTTSGTLNERATFNGNGTTAPTVTVTVTDLTTGRTATATITVTQP